MDLKLHLGNISNNIYRFLLYYLSLTILILCFELLQVETKEIQDKHEHKLLYDIHQNERQLRGINTLLITEVF